jgi:hypothetical protein
LQGEVASEILAELVNLFVGFLVEFAVEIGDDVVEAVEDLLLRHGSRSSKVQLRLVRAALLRGFTLPQLLHLWPISRWQ